MGFQMNITETYLNNMNIILLHVNICFAETTTGRLKLPLNFYSVHGCIYNIIMKLL